MHKLFLTTAFLLSISAGAAFAQAETTEAPAVPAASDAASSASDAVQTGLIRSKALEHADVYSMDISGEATWNDGEVFTAINTDWQKIGEAEDLVLDSRGDIVGVIAEVGGFLGMGEKEVVLRPSEMTVVTDGDEVAIITGLSQDELEQREELAEELRHRKD